MRGSRGKRTIAGRAGFSLIELSIVVAIFSIVSVLGLEVATSFLARSAYEDTKAKLVVVDRALRDFYWVYGRLPCPARHGYSINNSNYGIEDCNITPVNGDTTMLFGSVPVRTLNLQPSDGIDSYNSKIAYYVMSGMTTNAASFNATNGNVVIRSGRLEQPCTSQCSTLASDAIYAVMSRGADKRGAYSAQGIPLETCASSGDRRIDPQNCYWAMGGGPLVVTISSNVLYDSRYNPGSQDLNYFDDAIIWRRKGQL